MAYYENYDDYHDDEEENEYDATRGRKFTFGKILRKTFSYALTVLALAVIAFLVWRISSTGDPKAFKSFLWNDISIEAYNESPESFKALQYVRNDNLTPNGKFSASSVYFVPSIGQFQMTLRYNDSTVKKLVNELMTEYELKNANEVKEKFGVYENTEKELFVFTLSDNLGNVYTDYQVVSGTKYMYNYRRIIFDNIDMNATKVTEKDGETLTEAFEELYLNIYFIDDVQLSAPYAILTVYDTEHDHSPVDLKKYPSNDTPSKNLAPPPKYTVTNEAEETAQE